MENKVVTTTQKHKIKNKYSYIKLFYCKTILRIYI